MSTSSLSRILLAPSILAADLTRLGEQVREAEAAGADLFHIDVMDGQFVPNISFGVPVLAAVRRVTRLPLDVHLMIEQPERYLDTFVEAGADALTVHVEGAIHLHRTLSQIRALGARAGVTLNPATPPVLLTEVLPIVDIVLVMTVNPGFGGQQFLASQLHKIAKLREMLDESGSRAVLAADGGIGPENIAQVIAAGAVQIVAGSAIFNQQQSVGEAITALRDAIAVDPAQQAEAE